MTPVITLASRSAAPTTHHLDPVALHMEAVNACSMARWYAARHDHAKAARKATQAMVALRRLAATELPAPADPCTGCPQNFPLPDGPLDFFDQRVVDSYIAIRTACDQCRAGSKPCLKKGGVA